jgi:hypothetical protein
VTGSIPGGDAVHPEEFCSYFRQMDKADILKIISNSSFIHHQTSTAYSAAIGSVVK